MTPAVLLHGFAGGPWSFDEIERAVGIRRRVLSPCLTFHDPHQLAVLADADFESEVRRIAELIASSAAPVDLAGYSMGGRIALGVALARPDLIRRLVLISARRGLDSPEERRLRQVADEVWAAKLESAGLDAFLESWFAQPLFRSLAALPPERLRAEMARRREHQPAGLAAALRRFGLGNQRSYAQAVRHLQIPVTLVAGELDAKFVGLSRALATELPQGRLVVVKAAGHHLLLEAPRRVAQIIDEEPER